jgi:uncharacterized protein YdeI (YjbR/CyaY-like superfamily)
VDLKGGLPIVPFASIAEWEAWLDEHHASSRGLWVKIAKKDAGVPTVTYQEALEGALCYGWIDGQKGALDARHWLQRFTPRGARSSWSRINRDKVEQLIERGRMRPAGLAQVERARADGRWEAAYDSQSRATVPADLQREFDGNEAARTFFATLTGANRYLILYRLQVARTPELRQRRLAQFVEMLSEGRKLYP